MKFSNTGLAVQPPPAMSFRAAAAVLEARPYTLREQIINGRLRVWRRAGRPFLDRREVAVLAAGVGR